MTMSNDNRQKANEKALEILDKGRTEGIDALNEKQRIVFLVLELDAFLNMEGLFGFYPGVGGDQAMETEQSLRKIGALHSADLLHQAALLFPNGRPPSDVAELHRVLNSVDKFTFDSINELGARLLGYSADLSQKLEDYIHSNI